MENPAKVIPLTVPVLHGEREITELRFRRPKLREIRLFTDLNPNDPMADRGAAFDRVIQLAAALSGLPAEVIEDIDAADAETVLEGVTSFFEEAVPRATGAP